MSCRFRENPERSQKANLAWKERKHLKSVSGVSLGPRYWHITPKSSSLAVRPLQESATCSDVSTVRWPLGAPGL